MAKAQKLPNKKKITWRCKANWTDEYGKRRQKSFTAPTKKEAEQKADQFLIEKSHSMIPENKSLGTLIDEYIEQCSSILSPSTIQGYRVIRKNAFPSIIDTRLALLNNKLYQRAINEYAKSHSPKSVSNAHGLAVKVLRDNDASYIVNGIKLPQKEKAEVSIPTNEEVRKLLDYIEGTPLYLFAAFSVFLGLRKSETLALKWQDIDMDKGTVFISKAMVKGDDGLYHLKTTKTTESKRTLKMPTPLINALGNKGKPDEFVITSTPASLDSAYKRVKLKIDFPYNFHSLRHYYASVLLAQGMPNKYAQKLMGHATDNMLKQVYQHTFKSQEKKYEGMLEDFFSSI